MTSAVESKDGTEDRGSRKFLREWMWACCNCQVHSAMSVDILMSCAGCSHIRCFYCPLEKAKISINREGFHNNHNKKAITVSQPKARDNANDAPGPAKAQINTSLDDTVTSELKDGHDDNDSLGQLIQSAIITSRNADPVLAPRERKRRKETQMDFDTAQPTFACPYYKHDPSKYTDPMYRTCAVPNFPIDRPRLKEHLQSVHGPLYCDHCSKDFPDKKGPALLNHCKTCIGPPLHTKKGISSTQWKAIVANSRDQGALKGDLKRKRSETGWYEICKILLPDVVQRLDPYPADNGPQLVQCETLVALFQQITQQKVRNGLLPYDNDRDRIILETLREAYYTIEDNTSAKHFNVRAEEQPDPELSWITGTPSIQSGSCFALNSFQMPHNIQDNVSNLNGPLFDLAEVQNHCQPSQMKEFLSTVPFLAGNIFNPLPFNSTNPCVEDRPSWSPDSTIDPRVTLLQSDGIHHQSIRLDLLPKTTVWDEYQTAASEPCSNTQGVSSNPDELCITRHQTTLDTSLTYLMSGNEAGITLSSVDHQEVAYNLDAVLGITNTSHLRLPDAD